MPTKQAYRHLLCPFHLAAAGKNWGGWEEAVLPLTHPEVSISKHGKKKTQDNEGGSRTSTEMPMY